jgi:hypothetical protein
MLQCVLVNAPLGVMLAKGERGNPMPIGSLNATGRGPVYFINSILLLAIINSFFRSLQKVRHI